MNKNQLMGRLTKDPVVKYSEGDDPTTITRYTLAIDRRRKKGKASKTDFIPIVAFRGGGDFAAKHFKKGMRVVVCGRLQSYSYLNGDGKTIYGIEVVADEQFFADGRHRDDAGQQGAGYENGGATITPDAGIGDGFMNIPDGVEDEGLPFN